MATPKKSPRKGFTVGTFNLKNLVLPEHVYYGKNKYTQAAYDKKLEWLSRQAAKMEAGIIGFQEVFHSEALAQMIGKVERLKNAHVIVRGETGTSPMVGLVSKYPVLDVKSVERIPASACLRSRGCSVSVTRFSRPVLQTTLDVEGLELDVWVVHLKSKRPNFLKDELFDDPKAVARAEGRSAVTRTVESIGLRHLLLDRLMKRKRPLILLGDLNDEQSAVTTQIISGPHPWSRLARETKERIWSQKLYDAVVIHKTRSDTTESFYTHIYNGHYSQLDGIYVSNEFYPMNKDRIGLVQNVRVFNDHLVDETMDYSGTNPEESDHGQVTALIKLG